MTTLWQIANAQAKQLKKIKTKAAKRRQESLLLETLLQALRYGT
jgi:hypothetical protein